VNYPGEEVDRLRGALAEVSGLQRPYCSDEAAAAIEKTRLLRAVVQALSRSRSWSV